jgi:phosphatidylglycerophosphate synthase
VHVLFRLKLCYLHCAALYFISNVLDCADGQIARLKNGTKVGRIVDGLLVLLFLSSSGLP